MKEIRECPIHGLTEFTFYKSSSSKGQFKCNKCEVEIAVIKNQKRKIKAVEYKGGKCELCNYDKNISALEFHHLNPAEKDFTISGFKCGWDDLKRELDKCIMVCANCHREIHNPHSTSDNIKKMIEEHNIKLQVKQETLNRNRPPKYKFTLEEVEAKRLECSNWQEVADFYDISISTLKRHRKDLKNCKDIKPNKRLQT